jgi:hypothetical protein
MQMELLQRQYANQFREELCKNSKKESRNKLQGWVKKERQNNNFEHIA